ncbi:MAG: hypothetical protein M9907_16180 [Burkholderiaceae bacterium]|nr:hypothetical protein [Burkholderiaceae bacterium]
MTIQTHPQNIPAIPDAQTVPATLAATRPATCVRLNPEAAGTRQAHAGADA